MTCHTIPLERHPRRAQFDLFLRMANPQVGLTVPVDVTGVRAFARARDCSFFLAFLHLAAQAANSVPELRQRIRSGGIVEYDRCDTSHTELAENGVYCYCTLRHDMGWDEYIPYAREERSRCLLSPSLEEDEDVDSQLFVSCLPWLCYTQLIQPTAGPMDSHPRISWGKYERRDDRLIMPVTLQAHHALVDGIHIARFYERLNELIQALS